MLLFGLQGALVASIICPSDITITCMQNYTDLNTTGRAVIHGSGYNMARYYDELHTNSCDIGHVYRTWYADKNYNHIHDPNEVSCVQHITITDMVSQTYVEFPENRVYDCVDDIETEQPYYFGGPCDNFGVNIDDQVFQVVSNACYKILRHYTVINWCDYHPQDPYWNGQGIWEHTQVIKVVDEAAPRIQLEDDVTVGVGTDCKATVSLQNFATDDGYCSSDLLKYEFYIDTDWDGEVDSRYSYLESGDRYLAPAENGAMVTVNLVERFKIGTYKMKWVVSDGCGNIRTEFSRLKVVDNKAPTPYCRSVLTAGFDADMGELRVPASKFDLGGWDNCSWPEQIKVSFSEDVNDTIRTVDCATQGIQFYRVYYTDYFGNSDYCSAFLFAVDNDGCNQAFSPLGSATMRDGTPLADITAYVLGPENSMIAQAQSDDQGNFQLMDVGVYESFTVHATSDRNLAKSIDLGDLVGLHKHFLGFAPLDDRLDLLAADVDGDGALRPLDMRAMADVLLGRTSIAGLGDLKMVNSYKLEHEDDLQAVDNRYDLYNYRGGYPYTSYVQGDVNGSYVHILKEEVGLARPIVLNATYDGLRTSLYIKEGATSDGFAIKLPAGTSLAPVGMGAGSVQQYEDATHNKMISVTLGQNWEAGDLVLQIEGEWDATTLDGEIALADGSLRPIAVEASLSTDVEDVATSTIAVFPNPVKDQLFFSDQVALAELLSLDGRQLIQSRETRGLDVADLAAGTYILRLTEAKGNVQIQRVVVQ